MRRHQRIAAATTATQFLTTQLLTSLHEKTGSQLQKYGP
jgi:hypothetical protein